MSCSDNKCKERQSTIEALQSYADGKLNEIKELVLQNDNLKSLLDIKDKEISTLKE